MQHSRYYVQLQALIKFKNFFYFEEKDDPIEEFEKVCVLHNENIHLPIPGALKSNLFPG